MVRALLSRYSHGASRLPVPPQQETGLYGALRLRGLGNTQWVGVVSLDKIGVVAAGRAEEIGNSLGRRDGTTLPDPETASWPEKQLVIEQSSPNELACSVRQSR